MKVKLEKVYKVTFMQYTNAMKDTVSDWDGKGHSLADCEYLDVGKESFLLRESQLEYYRKFGKGYRNIEFVGQIPISKFDVNLSSMIKYVDTDSIKIGSDSTGNVTPPLDVNLSSTNNEEI